MSKSESHLISRVVQTRAKGPWFWVIQLIDGKGQAREFAQSPRTYVTSRGAIGSIVRFAKRYHVKIADPKKDVIIQASIQFEFQFAG